MVTLVVVQNWGGPKHSSKTDEALPLLKDSWVTLRSLGLYTSAPRRKQTRPQDSFTHSRSAPYCYNFLRTLEPVREKQSFQNREPTASSSATMHSTSSSQQQFSCYSWALLATACLFSGKPGLGSLWTSGCERLSATGIACSSSCLLPFRYLPHSSSETLSQDTVEERGGFSPASLSSGTRCPLSLGERSSYSHYIFIPRWLASHSGPLMSHQLHPPFQVQDGDSSLH